MSRAGMWATIGAVLLVILFGLVAWLVMGDNPTPWAQEGDREKMINECTIHLTKRGAVDAGNTPEQVKSACKCFANEFYPLVEGKSKAEAAALTKQPEAVERVRTMRKKCAYQAGVDGFEEWWNW